MHGAYTDGTICHPIMRVSIIPVARQRESPAGPNVPCERRTGPAEPHHHDTPVNDSYFSSWATITPHRGTGSQSTQRQRDQAGASIGTSTPCPPSRDSAKAQPAPTFPASAGPIPRSASSSQCDSTASSDRKNRCARGIQPCSLSSDSTTSVALPTMRSRSTEPKYRESKLLSRLSPIMK